jgi:hypothetical protein
MLAEAVAGRDRCPLDRSMPHERQVLRALFRVTLLLCARVSVSCTDRGSGRRRAHPGQVVLLQEVAAHDGAV